jgi:hypothetical protein
MLRVMDSAPEAGDIARIGRALGWYPTRFRQAASERGISETAARWIVAGEVNGRPHSAFVKIGASEVTARWTRVEYRNYGSLEGSFMPAVLGFDDDGERPVLALEDLSDAYWPPPWSHAQITAVLETLHAIRGTPPPGHLTRRQRDQHSDWQVIAKEPRPFLELGLCSASWLGDALPSLIAAAATAHLDGESLIHLDIRSDNVCIRDGAAMVIDWNHAAIGNGDLDIAFWLPSLQAEGGPRPEKLLVDPELAAWVAGFFCAHAGGPPLPEAPHVRPLQLKQARTALPWAARALGLPTP